MKPMHPDPQKSEAVTPQGGTNADLHAASGKLSAERIADLYGVSLSDLGQWIGRKKEALLKAPDADSIQIALRPYSDIAFLRLAIPGDNNFRKWLRTPNEHMRGKEPLYWIRKGRVRDVAGFVHGSLTGEPT